MGHEGKILFKREDKRVDQSSHNTCCNMFATNLDGEITGDKSIHQLSHPAELAFTHSHLVAMDSSIMEILQRLMASYVNSVGIVGMGGSGKTTLAKEVGKKIKELNIFDLVLFINVSRRSNEKEIQDQIADGLGLRWVSEDSRARAKQIFLTLHSGQQILIILDDIWNVLDLKQIGICNSRNRMGCRLLLTSRYASVIQSMECESLSLFRQYLLSDEDAWLLLCDWAGIRSISVDESKVAVSQRLASICSGWPLAALLAGGGLRGKTIIEWEATTNMLRQDSKGDFDTLILFLCQWSYEEGLSSKVARSLFLISGLFPEDDEIIIEHLSHYAIALGLCGQNEVNEAINNLIYRGLLMHYEESKDRVIMHDLVREAAQWIVENENPVHRDNIRRYLTELTYWGSPSNSIEFPWEDELAELLHQMFQVRASSSTSSIVAFSPHHVAVIAQPYTHPEPSGKPVDFKGLCQVDESYLPLLKEACKRYPQLIKCQAQHSKTLKQTAFNSLGQLLFMLNNAWVPDWVYLKDELEIYWDQTLLMEFNLEWLKPVVDRVLSSTEVHRIEALRKEEEKWSAEAAKLRQQLNDIEAEAAKRRQQLNHVELEATHFRTKIALLESKFKLNGFAITDVSTAQVVTDVTRRRNWKNFWKGK